MFLGTIAKPKGNTKKGDRRNNSLKALCVSEEYMTLNKNKKNIEALTITFFQSTLVLGFKTMLIIDVRTKGRSKKGLAIKGTMGNNPNKEKDNR